MLYYMYIYIIILLLYIFCKRMNRAVLFLSVISQLKSQLIEIWHTCFLFMYAVNRLERVGSNRLIV